jgi:alpha-glucosidase
MHPKSVERAWWQDAVFYQIYPRSFADGNGDGIGDLHGIISRLDYLADLGIDAIWLSPHYPSPLFDCGYDIADYTAVAPEYGTLEDFKWMLDAAHQRDIRVIIDLVLNHSSDQHPWFLESRASRDNPRRDWYIWRDAAADGEPPNDWLSTFGGPAWEFDPATGQYYYHYFFKEQPDLNWRNPEVKEAMFAAVRFWLDLGVDGFRLDAIGTIFENPTMPSHHTGLTVAELRRRRDEAQDDKQVRTAGKLWERVFGSQVDQPEVHDLMKELRALVDQYDDRVLVGETEQPAFHGDGTDELHLVFNFPLMRPELLTAAGIRVNQKERLEALPTGAWPANTLGNHDAPRVYSRFGDGEHDGALARLSLATVLTLRGTPFLYYGEEVGMTDLALENIEQFRDMLGVWFYHALQDERALPADEALGHAAEITRDKCRTPMQWGGGENGEFCPPGVSPWLPVHPNHTTGVNVHEQMADPDSLWNFYRSLLAVRRASAALICGDYVPLQVDDPDLLLFRRTSDAQICLVALNYSAHHPMIVADPALSETGRVLLGTHQLTGEVLSLPGMSLSPFEILICEIS